MKNTYNVYIYYSYIMLISKTITFIMITIIINV